MLFSYLRTAAFEWAEQKRVKRLYYPNDHFKTVDQTLLSSLPNPYATSKAYLQERKEANIYAYGETPITTLGQMAERFNITTEDTLIELGAGRGRGALFFSEHLYCTVYAFERVPLFVSQLQELKRQFNCTRLNVIDADFFTTSLPEATVVYLYGTMLTDAEITKLGSAFQKYPKSVKLITVSYPLSDYSPAFKTKDVMQGRFPWGKTEIYLNEIL